MQLLDNLRTAKSKLYSTCLVCMIYVYEFIKFSLLKINPKGMHVIYFRLSFGVTIDALFFNLCIFLYVIAY